MHLLVDENVHGVVVRQLRASGHEVEWIAESRPGASDKDILDRRDIGTLILITYDRDFGELIFEGQRAWPRAIIYSRLGRAEPRHIADRIAMLLDEDLPRHHIITLLRDRDRRRPFQGEPTRG